MDRRILFIQGGSKIVFVGDPEAPFHPGRQPSLSTGNVWAVLLHGRYEFGEGLSIDGIILIDDASAQHYSRGDRGERGLRRI